MKKLYDAPVVTIRKYSVLQNGIVTTSEKPIDPPIDPSTDLNKDDIYDILGN